MTWKEALRAYWPLALLLPLQAWVVISNHRWWSLALYVPLDLFLLWAGFDIIKSKREIERARQQLLQSLAHEEEQMRRYYERSRNTETH
jgi:hypothetical protein